jgi:hypothetical protein
MTHTIIHDEISRGSFTKGTKLVTVKSMADALEYYKERLMEPMSKRIKEQRQQLLEMPKRASRDFTESIVGSDDPKVLLSPQACEASFRLRPKARGTAKTRGFWPNIWKTHWYQHANFKGTKVSLNCTGSCVDYRTSLGSFNDQASSVDTGKLVILSIGCEHTWFRGNWWWFFVDDKDFSNNGCNDKISSVAATGLSVPALISLLKALAA